MMSSLHQMIAREPPRIRSERPEYQGGRIYEVDPEAVARLKRIVAAEAAQRQEKRQRRRSKGGADIVANLVRRSKAKAQEGVPDEMSMTREELIKLHMQYQAGIPTAEIARQAGYQWSAIKYWFKAEGLPVARKVADRYWRPDEETPETAVTADEPDTAAAEPVDAVDTAVPDDESDTAVTLHGSNGSTPQAVKTVGFDALQAFLELARSRGVRGIVSIQLEAQLDIEV